MSFISAIVSDRYQCRGYTAIFFTILQVVGFTMFYGMFEPSTRKGCLFDRCTNPASTSSRVRYASLFFSVTGAFCAVPALNAWLANNSAPHTRRATAVAVNFTMAELGGILSTWLLGSLSSAPNYTTATITFLAMSICTVVIIIANMAYLRRENRLKAVRRQKMGKEEEPEGLGDRSAWFIYSL